MPVPSGRYGRFEYGGLPVPLAQHAHARSATTARHEQPTSRIASDASTGSMGRATRFQSATKVFAHLLALAVRCGDYTQVADDGHVTL
jgi:hypothetical protein